MPQEHEDLDWFFDWKNEDPVEEKIRKNNEAILKPAPIEPNQRSKEKAAMEASRTDLGGQRQINWDQVDLTKKLPFQDGPYPADMPHLVDVLKNEGKGLRVSKGEYEDIAKHADLLLVQGLNRAGLNFLPTNLKVLMQRALTYNMVKYYAPLGDGERREAIQVAGMKVLDKALNSLDHKLRTLGPGEGEADPEPKNPYGIVEAPGKSAWSRRQKMRKKYEESYAILKAWRSRLGNNDPRAELVTRQLYAYYTDWQLEKDRLTQAENSGVRTELSRITATEKMAHLFGDDDRIHLRAGRNPSLANYQDSMKEMWNSIVTALRDTENHYAPEQSLALSLRGSIKTARLRAMGVNEEDLKKIGLFGTLMQSHPMLMAEAANLSAKRAHKLADEYGDRTGEHLTWEAKERLKVQNLFHTLYVLERIGAPIEDEQLMQLEARQITGAETREERFGKQIDDVIGYLGSGLMNVMGSIHNLSGKAVDVYRKVRESGFGKELTTRTTRALTLGMGTDALKSLDDTLGVGDEDYGLGRDSRLTQDIAKGIEAGEIQPEHLARILGDDKMGTMLFWGALNDLASKGPHNALTERLSRYQGLKLHPEALKEVGRQFREEFTNATVRPPGFKSLKELEDWYFNRMAMASTAIRQGRHVEGRALAFSASVVDQLFTGMWEMGGFLAKDPETVGVLAVGAFFGGRQLAKVGQKLGLDQMAARVTLSHRLRKNIKDLISHDPFYADTIRAYLQKHQDAFVRKGLMSEERLREMDGIMRVFTDDSMLDSNRLANLTQVDIDLMKKKRANPRIHRQLDRDLRHFDTHTLEEMLDLDHKGAQLIKHLRDPGRFSPVVSFIEDVMERTGYAKRRFNPRMRARAQNILQKISNMVDGGASLERFKSILFPFSGAVGPDKQSIWARLVRRFPQLQKSFTVLDAAKTSLLMKGAKFLQEVLPTITALRDYNNVLTGRQHRLVRALRNKQAGRLADYYAARLTDDFGDLLPDEIAELEKLSRADSRLTELEGQVLVRDWKHPVALSRHPDVVQHTSVGELLQIINAEDDMATHRLWTMLRRGDESIEAFEYRLHKLVGEETDLFNDNLIPEGRTRADFQKELRATKRELLEAYYDQHDLERVARLDLVEPDKPVFRPFKEAQAIYAERKAIAGKAARAQEVIDQGLPEDTISADMWDAYHKAKENPDLYSGATNYGFHDVQAGDEWKGLKRWAETFDAEQVAYIREAAPMLDPGDLGSFMSYMTQGGYELRNQFHYYSLRNQKNAEVYKKMAPEQRKAFDQAIEKLAEGDGRDWQNVMKKNPELAAAFGEGDDFAIAERMWKDNEDMRHMLMDWAQEAGMVPEEVHDYFLKYYAPQRYKFFSWKELNPKWVDKAAHEVIENTPDHKLADFEQFARQRDHYRHKVLVKRDGGVWIKRKFDTHADAVRWAEENVGLRRHMEKEGTPLVVKEKLMSTVDGKKFGERYKSFMDDDVVIMDPIGQEMLDYLRPQPTGENLFERMGKLARDVSFYNYLKMFDRPGWVVDKTEFSSMPAKMRKQWVEVPSGANGWGPFKGKYMHRRLAKRIQDYVEVDSALDSMRKNMDKIAQESWTSQNMMWLHKGLSALGGTARFFKKIIAQSRIQRNIRTIAGNVMWDKQKTARAVDPQYLYDPRAREAERTAYRILLGAESWTGLAAKDKNVAKTLRRIAEKGSLRRGSFFDPSVEIDPESVEFLAEAIRHGIIGDTPLGSHLTGKDRAMALELQYGNGLAKPLRKRIAKRVGKLTEPIREAAAKGFTKIPGHEAAKTMYNKMMKRLGFKEDESVFELVGKYFTGTADYEGSALRREIAELDRILDDVKEGRRVIPHDKVMDLEYEREAKAMALKSVGDETWGGLATDALNGLGYLFGAKSSYGRFGTMNNWSHDFYQRLGNVHKLGVYLYMRQKGVPEVAALSRIRNFMQNYNALPTWMRHMQRSDLATVANPVFSFGYEFWRIQKNIFLHHPELMAATWALVPTASFMAMATQGHNVADLWWTEAKNEGAFDAFTNAIRTLYLPTPDGGYSTHRLTFMDEFAVLNKPTGVLGYMVDNARQHRNVVANVAARTIAPFFLENLQTNAAYAVLFGKDPLTQKKLEGGTTGAMANATRQVIRMAQPGWVPWSGDFHDMLETYRRPPRLRTRFMVEASEKLLQIMGGYVTRGGFWSQVADGTTGLKCSEHVNHLLLKTASVGEKFDLPLRSLGALSDQRAVVGPEASIPAHPLRARGFNDKDIFMTLFYANAKMDENYEETGRDGVQNFSQMDMFNAAHLVHEGKKRGDKNMVSIGLQLRDGAKARVKERMNAQEQFAELRKLNPEVYQEMVDKEILRIAENAAANMDLTYAFNRGGLRQKIVTLVEASALGLDEDLIDESADIMMHTTRFNFLHSMDFNDAAKLQAALVDLEEHINNPGPSATGIGKLSVLYTKMNEALPDVLQRDAMKIVNDEVTARAYDLLEEEVLE